MKYCPECRRPHAEHADVCGDCWTPLSGQPPAAGSDLALVWETRALYEADLLEALLWDEGIPCVRVPRTLSLPAGLDPLSGPRVYVRSDMADAARELAEALLGPGEPSS